MLCPKCRQPIEGDEPYICCADATLQWRCQSCAKVSEGFAFPYGKCPHCGGTLEVLEARQLDDAKALDSVRMAFEIELGGQAFYRRAAGETTEPALRELFESLAEMEQEHMETLSRRYHADVPAPSPEFRIERAAIYAGIENRPEDPANLLRIAIACEQRAVAFFTGRGEAAAEGSIERQLYRELAAEEREHVALLTTEYDRWKAGKPGLL
jgi:glutamate synthase (NADPH/NADH) small chain